MLKRRGLKTYYAWYASCWREICQVPRLKYLQTEDANLPRHYRGGALRRLAHFSQAVGVVGISGFFLGFVQNMIFRGRNFKVKYSNRTTVNS